MECLGLNEIRNMFRDFFVTKGHYAADSASLIPKNDKSLLIINSGMAPLKPYFSGAETPPSTRMTTCQKCIRTGDIDNVGKTTRHGTFFEMLGNFSFGDYFKKESLTWGWEFITEYLKLPKERLWATVYEEDQESYDIWKQLGMPAERIVKLGKKDNFWEIGLGPCGPDSEIFYDRGEEYGCGKPNCKPGCDCDRYMEFWNHVFTQFSRDEDGSYSTLAHPNIDTGMGLERIACIMQNVDSIFDVDTIRYILDAVIDLAGIEYEIGNKKNDISVRIITDHIRSIVFMIADGILPSNEGRGYVLRRLLRRACRHGKLLGIDKAFLSELSSKVIEVSGEAYPELVEKRDYIEKIIYSEERQFAKTMQNGLEILEEYMSDLRSSGKLKLLGERAFKLYDTYGFPVEVTEEILKENGMSVDMCGFNENMQLRKEDSRGHRRNTSDEAWKDSLGYDQLTPTDFLGYEKTSVRAKVLYIGTKMQGDEKQNFIIFDSTPFYATSGGQIHDVGTVEIGQNKFKVIDVIKENNVFLHIIDDTTDSKLNSVTAGDMTELSIDLRKRNRTARAHSATHLLQQALRDVLGDHVMQAGSYVDDRFLRFDFNHFHSMTDVELIQVEEIVNDKIDQFLSTEILELPIEKAKKLGAMAIFGEKYGDVVRVVKMGDYSIEFCGGTHVKNTGEIGAFKILSEYGTASGVRRIEAAVGTEIAHILAEKDILIEETAAVLKSRKEDIAKKSANLVLANKELEKNIKSIKSDEISGEIENIISSARNINGIHLITKRFDNIDISQLREISDSVKAREKNAVIVLAAVNEGKATFVVSVTDELISRGLHAGKLIKDIAKAAGGGGGGKADLAQAGAKNPDKLDDAFMMAETLLRQ